MKTKTYDFRSFVADGKLVRTDERQNPFHIMVASGGTVMAPVMATAQVQQPDIATAFDPVIVMLQNMALPIASIVLAWSCLQAMIGHPAQAVDKAKWAVLGYLAMKYVPGLLKSIGG